LSVNNKFSLKKLVVNQQKYLKIVEHKREFFRIKVVTRPPRLHFQLEIVASMQHDGMCWLVHVRCCLSDR